MWIQIFLAKELLQVLSVAIALVKAGNLTQKLFYRSQRFFLYIVQNMLVKIYPTI